ncbi:MAG: starch-binding protein, partial [Paludibacteraceae bacterium]|nr:starch-binding protein [Paludibacteraceae bacterium]
MRKITLFFVALMSVLMLSAATETVYFVNANNWTGTIKAHLWGGTATGTSWNGNAMTKESEQIAGFDVYSYSAEAGAYANVIFNNGSAQTADLTWTAGKYYVKDGWYTKDEAVVKLGQPIEYETVYFVDAYKWGSVNIYTWTPEVGTWPGKAMTKESEQIAGYDVYSYTVEKGTSFGGLNFNCKGDNSKKTGDLKWTAGKYYVKDAWYTKEEAEKGLAPSVKLAGTLSSWDGTVMELSDDYKTASLTLTLDAKEYELKIIEEGAWFGNAGTMTRGNSSDWTFSSEVGDNCKITADVAGEYVFTWTFETNKLTVTYPELAPAITATWSIEEG